MSESRIAEIQRNPMQREVVTVHVDAPITVFTEATRAERELAQLALESRFWSRQNIAAGGTYPFTSYRSFVDARRAMFFYRPDPDPRRELAAIIRNADRIEAATGVAIEKVWEDERWDINGAGGRLLMYGVGLGLAGLGAGIAIGVASGATAGGPYGAVIGAGIGVTVGIVLAVFPFRAVQLLADYRAMLDLMTPIERWPLYCQTRRLVNQARGLTSLAGYPGDFRYGNYGTYTVAGGGEALAFLLGETLFETDSMVLDNLSPRVGPSDALWDDNASNRFCALWAIGDLPDNLQCNQSRYFNKAQLAGHKNAWVADKLRAYGTMPAGDLRARCAGKGLVDLDTLPTNARAIELAALRNRELIAQIAARGAR